MPAEKKVAFITGVARRQGRVAPGLDRFGRMDVLLAKAGIVRLSPDGDRDVPGSTSSTST